MFYLVKISRRSGRDSERNEGSFRNRSVAAHYFKKAKDNYDQMQKAYTDKNWNATATLAVQCAISAGDAVCVFGSQMRSISPDHMNVCVLVAKVPVKDSAAKAKQLQKVIMRKNIVQYESRNMNRSDADTMVKATERFYEWVKNVVTGS